jgi:hypothetical protein
MRSFETAGRRFHFQWASDQAFDGLRLEAREGEEIVLDVSVPTTGPMTINTFSHDVPAELAEAAMAMAREDRGSWR